VKPVFHVYFHGAPGDKILTILESGLLRDAQEAATVHAQRGEDRTVWRTPVAALGHVTLTARGC
jgi:hypothetical protein